MSVQQSEESPKVEAPFSLFVRAKLSELSEELVGGTGSGQNPSTSEGLTRGKPLSKPKSRLDAYRVSRSVYNFSATAVDVPLRDRDVREPETVTIPTSLLQRLEQDARILTMIGSFLECSGFSANSLLDEVSQDPRDYEATRGCPVCTGEVQRQGHWARDDSRHHSGC